MPARKCYTSTVSASVIDTYLARLPEAQRAALQRVRNVILQAAPETTEVIAYGMPGFTYRGKYLAGFNALKHHLALYPTAEPIEVLLEKLSDFSLSRGTIRFTLNKPIPDELIRELVAIRKNTIDNQ